MIGAVAVHAASLYGAGPTWLEQVAPLMSPAEKKAYVSLDPASRTTFEEDFWANKSIAKDEYFRRFGEVDARFGSSKAGSGANTDEGRVYLSIGPPSRITRLPSSRIFVPLEIWYYDTVPGVLNTEVRLIFFRKSASGLPRLYSPVTDTIRALLLPISETRSMFGPNDSVSESSIRQILKPSPAEDEIIPASVAIATGVKTTENDQILASISSPFEMLGKPQHAEVKSKFIVTRPRLDVLESLSAFGGSQVDLRLETTAAREIDLEVREGNVSVYRNRLQLTFAKGEPVAYTHRLDLLPGAYRLFFTVDSQPYAYDLEVHGQPAMGLIQRVNAAEDSGLHRTPFEYDGRNLSLHPEGTFAMVTVGQPGKVKWAIRDGAQTVWRAVSDAREAAIVELPLKTLPPGSYRLEAISDSDSQNTLLVVKRTAGSQNIPVILSFNANLAPARRYLSVGHQWLVRGQADKAREVIGTAMREGSGDAGLIDEAQVELARAEALGGSLDAARERVRGVLTRRPDSFEALSVFAYVEARLQDYPAAAELYRRALAVQESPELRAALQKLPVQ